MKSYLLKIKSSILGKSSHENLYEKKSIRPGRDWKIILITSQLVVIILALISFYFYKKINNGEFFQAHNISSESQTQINVDLLRKVSGDLIEREEKFNQINGGVVVPTDPSL